MKRRDFVNAGTAALATSAFNPAAGGAPAGARPNNRASIAVKIAIENGSYRVEVDSESGLILRLLDKKRPVDLTTEPSLADNFTPLLPLPDLEANYIYGREQQLSSHEKTANRLTLTWNGPLKNPRSSFDVDVVRCAQTVSACV